MAEPKGDPPGANETQNADIKALRNAFELAQKRIGAYGKMLVAADEGAFLDAAAKLSKKANLSIELQNALLELVNQIQRLSLDELVASKAKEVRLHYREDLERRFALAGLAITGDWPNYVIENVIQLKLDLARQVAAVDGKRLGTVEPVRVVSAVEARVQELLKRPFNETQFLQSVADAYSQLSSKQIGVSGYVDIRALARAVREWMQASGTDSSYGDDKFAVDLFRLTEGESFKQGRTAHIDFSPAQNAAGGLRIPSARGGNFIAAIRVGRTDKS